MDFLFTIVDKVRCDPDLIWLFFRAWIWPEESLLLLKEVFGVQCRLFHMDSHLSDDLLGFTCHSML